MLAIVLVLVVGGIINLIGEGVDGGGSGAGPPGGYAPELEVAWSVDSYDLTKDYGIFDSVDGTLVGNVLETDTGWIVMTEAATLEATLSSINPATGAVQWSTAVPEALCTLTPAGGVVCLTRESGSPYQLVTVSTETGEIVGDAIATDLTHVPAFLTAMGSAGFVTLSVDATLTGLDLQGETLWSQEIDTGDYDVDSLEPDVAQYESSAVLYLGWLDGAIFTSPEGAVVHDCSSVAATPEAWLCAGDDGATGYDPAGAELWSGDWHDYYMVDQYLHIAPVALANNWDGTVSAIDPLTGDHGPAVSLTTDAERSSFNFLGDAEHPFVFSENSVNLLDPTLSTVLWSTPIQDEYLNIAGGGVAGDILAVDAQHSYGFDLATGEMLWERAFVTYDAITIDDAFVGVQTTQLIRYELP